MLTSAVIELPREALGENLRQCEETEIFVDDRLFVALRLPTVGQFLENFSIWNEFALPFMTKVSEPYRDQQRAVARLATAACGEVLVDYGCGLGGTTAQMLLRGAKPKRVIAIDPDANVLRKMPANLRIIGYRGEIHRWQTASMYALPLKAESIDTVISGLGGITYAHPWIFQWDPIEYSERGQALASCLHDAARVLRPNGHLVFSSLLPNPDFNSIRTATMRGLLQKLAFGKLFQVIRKGKRIQSLSQFMKEHAARGEAHYLSEEAWVELLAESGFDTVEVEHGIYAHQGIAIKARKRLAV